MNGFSDMAQFHRTFFEESSEGLQLMESALLNLNVGAAEPEVINSIFRAAHSIKGGSATFGFIEIADFTHLMETLLDEMRDGRRQVTQTAVELLLRAVDSLRALICAAQGGVAVSDIDIARLKTELQALLNHTPASLVPATVPGNQTDTTAGWHIRFRPATDVFCTGNDPLRILREIADLGEIQVRADLSHLPDWGMLDPESCHLGWEIELHGDITRELVDDAFAWVIDESELDIEPMELSALTTASELSPEAPGPSEAMPETRSAERRSAAITTGESSSIRVSTDKIDDLINMVGELVITQSMLGQLGIDLEDVNAVTVERLRDGLAELERNTRELQESVMRIRMLPISFSFNRFPRLVHDLSKKLDKKIELKMSGEQTELDKTVMEKIGDPLVHLVRNSLDHGIESPAERTLAGKPETGTVYLNAYHQGGNIIIEISDDGRGMDRDKILAKARERGLVGEHETLSDERIYELIFLPGFSTTDAVSDLSGRGVGMDVVRRNIIAMGGSVEIQSTLGKGSTIRIRLPLTLAILDGQLVQVGNEIYIIPLVSIIESLQIEQKSVSTIAGKAEMYRLRGDYIPIVRMRQTFNQQDSDHKLDDRLLVVVEGDGKKIGLIVDDLLGQQQVVIKSLETNFRKVEGLSGATILGDGKVALILDVSGLIRVGQDSSGSSWASNARKASQAA